MKRLVIGVVVAAVLPLAAYEQPVEAAVAAAGVDCKGITHRGLYQGTENQPAGVTEAAKWGWAEVDASVTENGVIAATHDFNLRRLTGGDTNLNINQVTWTELRSFDHPYGEFRLTTNLIQRAGQVGSPLMVTINKWGSVPSQYKTRVLDNLYAAAQATPNPDVIFFGGADAAMHAAHPDQATFKRFNSPPPDDPQVMIDYIVDNDVDLAAVPKPLWRTSVVRDVRAAGAWAATPQIVKDEAPAAIAAGLRILQANSGRAAVGWCQ